jgi:hypothetical protein
MRAREDVSLCDVVRFGTIDHYGTSRNALTEAEIDGWERGYAAGLCGAQTPRPRHADAALAAAAQLILDPGFEDVYANAFEVIRSVFLEEVAILAGWSAGDREHGAIVAGAGCLR